MQLPPGKLAGLVKLLPGLAKMAGQSCRAAVAEIKLEMRLHRSPGRGPCAGDQPGLPPSPQASLPPFEVGGAAVAGGLRAGCAVNVRVNR